MAGWRYSRFPSRRKAAAIRVDKIDTAMGTVISQVVFGPEASQAADRVTAEIRRLEERLSAFIPGSDVVRLNAAAGEGGVPVSPDTLVVLAAALQYAEQSGGAYDCTVGPLIRVWREALAEGRQPGTEEIAAVSALINSRDLLLNPGLGTARLVRRGQAVDLGGIAKGYAADRALDLYRAMAVTAALVNLGGNVAVTGPRPDGSPWRVGVRDPRREGVDVGVLSLTAGAAVTSGDYERYTMVDDVRYHHLLDPRTGGPAAGGLVGVTVVADTGMTADALSTATFVLGAADGLELVRGQGAEAILVTVAGELMATSGMGRIFSPAAGQILKIIG